MSLEEKIALVKNDILTRFPGSHYTIRILLWDDGSDLVECRTGTNSDEEGKATLKISTYYNEELKYQEEDFYVYEGMLVDQCGIEYSPRNTEMIIESLEQQNPE